MAAVHRETVHVDCRAGGVGDCQAALNGAAVHVAAALSVDVQVDAVKAVALNGHRRAVGQHEVHHVAQRQAAAVFQLACSDIPEATVLVVLAGFVELLASQLYCKRITCKAGLLTSQEFDAFARKAQLASAAVGGDIVDAAGNELMLLNVVVVNDAVHVLVIR